MSRKHSILSLVIWSSPFKKRPRPGQLKKYQHISTSFTIVYFLYCLFQFYNLLGEILETPPQLGLRSHLLPHRLPASTRAAPATQSIPYFGVLRDLLMLYWRRTPDLEWRIPVHSYPHLGGHDGATHHLHECYAKMGETSNNLRQDVKTDWRTAK